ncbi:MAG: prepilin-type N-terminal cleavage/methylation domain-containing protein [Patescibacteria group bacterium]
MKKGFSLVELIVIVAIVALISSIAVFSFKSFNARHAVDEDALGVLSTLNEARSKVLASKDASQYGVHLEEFQIVLFKGTSYSANDPLNQIIPLSQYTHISNINLSGGASDIIFARLTGAANRSGTIVLASINDSTLTKTITVYATGVSQSN